MKNKILIVFIVFVMLIPSSLANEEKLFSDWKYPGETIVANDLVFSFSFIEDPSHLRLRYNNNYKHLVVGECDVLKRTNETIRVCYDRNEYDLKKREFKAYLRLYLREPDIEITRTFEDTDLIVGDEIWVDVQILNKGSSPAYNLLYEDDLDNFKIIECESCTFEDNKVIWKKSGLNQDDTEEFSYKIKPLERFDRKIAAVLKFDTLKTSEEIITEAVSVTAENILELKTKLVDVDYFADDIDNILRSGIDYTTEGEFGTEKNVKGKRLDEIYLGDSLKLIIELTNNLYDEDENNKIKIRNLEIRIPKNYDNIKESRIKAYFNRSINKGVGAIGLEETSENIFQWGGQLMQYRKYFVLEMDAELSGFPSIYTSIEFEESKKIYSIDDVKETLKIINITPVLTIGFEKRDPGTKYYTKTEYLDDDYVSESNQKEIMKLRLINPSTKIKLRDVLVTIDSAIFSEPLRFNIREINSSGSILIDKREFYMPSVNKSRNFPFNVNLKWTTEFGEELNYIEKKKIRVEAIRDIEISHKFSKSAVDSGEEFFVTVSLMNRRPAPIYNITASDDIGIFILKGGITSQKTDIKEDIKIEIYKYKLVAPKVKNKTKICINTSLGYIVESSEYLLYKDGCIDVKPKKIDLRIEDKVDESKVYLGEIFEVKHIISNKDEESAFDIWFDLPIGENFDLIAPYPQVSTSRLDENEVWRVEGKHKTRAKKAEKIKLEPIILNYKDEYGNEFNQSGKRRIVNVEEQKVNTPMLMISKILSSDSISENESLNVTLIIENIGLGFASEIKLSDYGKGWEISKIGTHDKKIIKYTLDFDELGYHDLGRAKLSYTDGLWNYLTGSEHRFVDVYDLAKEEENYTIVVEKDEEVEEEKVNIIEKIINFIKSVLFWTKEGDGNV